MVPLYLFSDLHIGHPEWDRTGVEQAVAAAEKEGARILLNGDTLDLWYASIGRVEIENFLLLKRIGQLLFDVVWGNHDSPLVFSPPVVLSEGHYPLFQPMIDGRLWFMEHGHLIGQWGWLFSLLDEVDDKVWFRKIARWVINRKLMKHSGRASDGVRFREDFICKAKLHGATVAFAGHTHQQELYHDQTGQTEVTYINPGSAIGKMTYAVYRDGKFYLEK